MSQTLNETNASRQTPSGATPMMRQYWKIKSQCSDALLFFRMGDFYEMFFDDAKLAAPILGIALTSREKKSDNPVPMCGVPHHSAGSYITKLIDAGYRVAVCDQVEDPRLAKGLVKREVTRIVTAGTRLSPEGLSADRPNYLGSLAFHGRKIGLSCLDISTGQFLVSEFDSIEEAGHELNGRQVRELILPESLQKQQDAEVGSCQPSADDQLQRLQSSLPGLTFRFEPEYLFRNGRQTMLDHFVVRSLAGFGLEEKDAAVKAAGALLEYAGRLQRRSLSHVERVRFIDCSKYMVVDDTTRKNLELLDSVGGGGKKHTLFGALNFCGTSMGQRKLREWIEHPLLESQEIQLRLDAVDEMQRDFGRLEELRGRLKGLQDIPRVTSRLLLTNVLPRELALLRESLERVPEIRKILQGTASELLSGLEDQLETFPDLVSFLAGAIADEPPPSCTEGGVIRKGFNKELDELREIQREGKGWLADLEAKERKRTCIPNLKVRYNRVFGYYIEVTRSYLGKLPDDYERRQTLVGAERFITGELKAFEERILKASERAECLEERLYGEVKERVLRERSLLMRLSDALARLDVLCALAQAALEYGYNKPVINDERTIRIKGGRHPVVERFLADERFVPNDLRLDDGTRQLLIVTGPNMSGKSTFLRQVALITLMAQMGSFVPARAAEIGIADRIFTRIGAADDISMGRSTFMVEMEETANILRNATAKSLLILDEIGRGTSTFDGMSIAWAVAEHIHDCIEARTLFATHYHELTELSQSHSKVHNVHFAVSRQEGRVIFLRQLLDGGISRSYGVDVGSLAGLPAVVIARAREVLSGLEEAGSGRVAGIGRSGLEGYTKQLSLFEGPSGKLLAQLGSLDINEMKPIEALELLSRWQRDLEL